MTHTNHWSQKGFTLIEILTVMVIMGILTSLAMSNYLNAQVKSRDTQRKTNLDQVAKALEIYYNDKGRYPTSNSTGQMVGCDSGGSEAACSWGGSWTGTNDVIYMVQLPVDPAANLNYFYVSADGVGYQLYGLLENERDSEAADPAYTGTNCGGGQECNYGISSPNTAP